MTTFDYSDVTVTKDYRNDGLVPSWIVEFKLHLKGDTYEVFRAYEPGEYGESDLSIMYEGLDLTDSRQWPTEEMPHVIREFCSDADGTYLDMEWLCDWIDEQFIQPVWAAADAAETAAMDALKGAAKQGVEL